jgi:RNA polymerase sigma-70 factor, ECF subfamily
VAGTQARPSALELVFADHYARLVSVLSVAAGDRARAEDAVQDAFAQALIHWDRVGSYEDPVAWLRRVATNRILNQRRSRRRHDSALARLQPADEPSTAPQAHTAARVDLVAAISRLPVQQRTAVALFYLADLTSEQVAEAMGISDGTVRFHLHEARQALNSQLEVK